MNEGTFTKNDLTEYSDGELSQHVFNDEGLYNERHRAGFTDTLSEYFNYTDEQMSELKQDLEDDLEEIEAEDE